MENQGLISGLKNTISNYEQINKNQQMKIISQQQTIDELNNRINDLESAISDNIQLSNEVNYLNEIINEKNKIIAEFQHLAQVSYLKFESYINNNQINKNTLEKKNQKIK
jgi:uncharacterized coiled-coil protein SlyX